MADEEIEVEITDKPDDAKGKSETPVEIEAASPPVDKKEEERPIISPEEGVDKLKANLEAANKRAEDESRRRREAEAKAADAGKQIQDAELREVTGAIDIVTRDLETAKSNYKAARASGDIDAEVAATEQIGDAKAKLNALEAGKSALEQRAKQPVRPVAPANDPVEALASSIEATGNPRSAAWVRAHPQYAQSQQNYNKMLGAHYRAMAEGHAPETDGYFDFINSDLGHAAATTQQPTAPAKPTEPTTDQPMSNASRPVAPPAAPVSRQAPGSPRPGTMRLTKDQAEAAEISFPDLPKAEAYRQYAKNLQALQANGRMN